MKVDIDIHIITRVVGQCKPIVTGQLVVVLAPITHKNLIAFWVVLMPSDMDSGSITC